MTRAMSRYLTEPILQMNAIRFLKKMVQVGDSGMVDALKKSDCVKAVRDAMAKHRQHADLQHMCKTMLEDLA